MQTARARPIRLSRSALLICGLTVSPASVLAQSWPSVMEGLLETRAPVADWRDFTPYRDSPPPDDAPHDVLTAWWSRHRRRDEGSVLPSDAVRDRFFEAVKSRPSDLVGLLEFLPRTAEVRAFVERWKEEREEESDEGRDEWISKWLHHPDLLTDDELFERAANAHRSEWSIVGERAVRAIVSRDPDRARGVLEGLTGHEDSYVRALAWTQIYEHSTRAADISAARAALERFEIEGSHPEDARALAIETLMARAWEGRDAWLLGLFEGSTDARTLRRGVRSDPDVLIPKVARLVAHADAEVHDKAVAVLVAFHLRDARADALRPLLPWLEDPTWSSVPDRLRLIQSLDRVHLPESVPGLIEVIGRRAESSFARKAAASALAVYRDARATPGLRAALREATTDRERQGYWAALLAIGAIEVDERAAAVEAYARHISTEDGSELWETALASWHLLSESSDARRTVLLGWILRDGAHADEAQAARLIERADALVATDPATALSLRRLLSRWTHSVAAQRTVQDIRRGAVDTELLLAALATRESIAQHASASLRELMGIGSFAGGVAVVLLEDREASRRILASTDRDAQLALLASARRVRMPLDVDLVGGLLDSSDQLLARAAEAYLVAEDSRTARELVFAHHPGGMVVLGARSEWDPGHFSFHDLGEDATRLVAEMRRDDAPDQIIALLSAGYWGDDGQWTLYVRGERVDLLRRIDESRYLHRTLESREWDEFREYIEESRFFDLPPLTTSVVDGIQYEALRLTKRGGRRVFMNNPGVGGSAGSPYHVFIRRVYALAAAGDAGVRYDLFDLVPGARLVLSHEDLKAVAVTSDGVAVWLSRDGDSEWRRLDGDELAEAVRRPSGWPDPRFAAINAETMRASHLNASLWQAVVGDDVILAGSPRDFLGFAPGLRTYDTSGEESRRLATGVYANTIVSSDGEWIVAAKAGPQGWAMPNGVVRIRLKDGEELAIDRDSEDTHRPVSRVAGRDAVLVYWARDDQTTSGFYLCDPRTGETRDVEGEFRPWFHQASRPLQATGREDEVWAAIPGDEETHVGRYRTREFEFESVATYPRIRFSSEDAWVDEEGGVVYVVHGNDLLALPLRS